MVASSGRRASGVARVVGIVSITLASVFVATATSTTMTIAASVTPTVVNSNIGCTYVSPTVVFGFDATPGAPAGTYPLPGSGNGTVTIAPNNAKTFNWSSTYPLDAVIVFGGASANVYRYSNVTGDSALSSPIKSGKLPDISHVWFCHDGIVPPTVTIGKASVAGARGVALADIPATSLDVGAAAPAINQQLAGSPALKSIPALKSSPVLR